MRPWPGRLTGKVERLAAVSEGVAAAPLPPVLGVQGVLALVILLPHLWGRGIASHFSY
jgi:hypothetical protein